MANRIWTTARLATLKQNWEGGASAMELMRLFPGHSHRALETQARNIGAMRPSKQTFMREKVIDYLERNAGVTIVQTARDLGFGCEQIRRVINILRRDGLVHVCGFYRVAALYAYGQGEDMSRETWAMQAHHDAKTRKSQTSPHEPSDWPAVRFTQAHEHSCPAPKDPLMAAFYSKAQS